MYKDELFLLLEIKLEVLIKWNIYGLDKKSVTLFLVMFFWSGMCSLRRHHSWKISWRWILMEWTRSGRMQSWEQLEKRVTIRKLSFGQNIVDNVHWSQCWNRKQFSNQQYKEWASRWQKYFPWGMTSLGA